MSAASILGQVVTLQLSAPESEWSPSHFDRLEVWRSMLGPNGPYEELTAAAWSGPRLPQGAGDPPAIPVMGRFETIVGKTLEVLLNERERITVTFTGTDPIQRGTIAAQITSQSLGRLFSYVLSDGSMVVESLESGGQAILRILPSEGAGILGLPSTEPESVAYGHDARLLLVSGQDFYSFLDPHGSSTAFYRTRYSTSSNDNVSAFSAPIPAQSVLPLEDLVTGFLDLVDTAGRPLPNREVRVESSFNGLVVSDRTVVPVSSPQTSKLTDKNGHVEFLFVRGLVLTVGISGTNLARKITVPPNPAVKKFNLFDPSVGKDDLFSVTVPDVDFAFRSTL